MKNLILEKDSFGGALFLSSQQNLSNEQQFSLYQHQFPYS